MRLDQRQEHRLVQRQELRLTQQLIHKLELLQLPALELNQLVQQELQENPVLEIKEEPSEPAQQTEPSENGEQDEQKDQAEQEKLDYLDDIQDQWQGLNRSRSRGSREELSEKYQDMIQNIEAAHTTLEDHLMAQVRLMDLPAETKRVIEVILGQLDEDGYLRRVVRDSKGKIFGYEDISMGEIAGILVQEEPFTDVPPEEFCQRIDWALVHVVQKLDPRGIGARTIKEALLAQLPEEIPFHDIKVLLIEKYLDDIGQNKLPKLARELLKEPLFVETFEFNVHTDRNEIIDTLKTLIADIQKLNPRPAREFGGHGAMNIVPEIVIRETEPGEFDSFITDGFVPEVFVNESYKRILRDPKASREQKDFIRKKLGAARALVEAIMHRRLLIEKVARRVVEHQKDFFAGSVEDLRPLKMKTLANEFGVHISTISRAVNGKYVQCPQGIFPLKFFFATSASRSNMVSSILETGEKRAKVTILDKLSEIIANEDKTKPMSDEEIARKLKEDGVTASRRAITKYRKELGIASSKVRKQY